MRSIPGDDTGGGYRAGVFDGVAADFNDLRVTPIRQMASTLVVAAVASGLLTWWTGHRG